MEGTPVFCRACGKQIEEGARFCRFCGNSQVEGPGAATGSSAATRPSLAERLRRVFPRHHLQDEITHFLTVAAMVIGVAGFLIALFPPLGGGIYALAWLLFAILLLLFVMHREATLGQTRAAQPPETSGGRYHAARGEPSGAKAAKPEK